MCDPLTAILGIASVGASLFGGKKQTQAAALPPPPAVAPAPDLGNNREETVVKSGPTEDDRDKIGSTTGTTFVAQRKAGTSIGGLGRSGLTLGL